jgi:hypothetical protein
MHDCYQVVQAGAFSFSVCFSYCEIASAMNCDELDVQPTILLIICFMFIELRLSNIRLGRHGDAADDEDPTTSGRYSGGLFSGRFSGRSTASDIPDSMVSKAPKVLMTLTSLTLSRLTTIERNYDQISERTLVNNFKCLIFYIISFV